MSRFFFTHRFLILRRISQITLLVLLIGANRWGWKIITGNLTFSELFEKIPLTDPFALLQVFAAGASVKQTVAVGALIVALFYVFLGGRSFCSWICPVNLVTDAAGGIRRGLKMDFEDEDGFIRLSRNVRYWMIGISLILSMLLGVAAFEFISPVSMMHRGLIFGIGFGWMAVGMIFLFDLLAVRNGWCGHLCPLGGFYSLIGRNRLIQVRHTADLCSRCDRCIAVCPEKEILSEVGKQSGTISHGECVLCGRCVEVCEENALRFGIRKILKRRKT
ncbi:MAG: quinol dehydrogenase ferredoxin subunit NapH [Deltaproteobacteria bacterium]|nr:quinol dehydrogenase ferredoxin subunit NapH [Deltaproteobacteria bacterium]